jgi:cysteinyl-tRNA synthetase
MTEGLADDMNTAVAMAAIFDLVRETNIAADNGELRQDDVAPIQAALKQFDEIFDVLRDDDAEKTRFAYQWAKSAGVAFDAKVGMQVEAEILYGDEHIKQLVEERNRAKQARDFRRSDEIRDELAKAGVILEDTKDGVRWKRK